MPRLHVSETHRAIECAATLTGFWQRKHRCGVKHGKTMSYTSHLGMVCNTYGGSSELLDPVGQFGFFFLRPFGWESP